jgi:hypothetical protein
VQRADRAARTIRGVEPVGFVERAAVDGLERVQRRSGVIVRVDAL